jgi:CRISPR-associated protein Cas1
MSSQRLETSERSQVAAPELVPARMLNEFAYCPRLAYLEWVQGEFEDSADTVEGRFHHRRVDEAGSKQEVEVSAEADDELHIARSVMLSAERAGLIARIDLLEVEGEQAVPVDYKRGSAPPHGAEPWEPERVQLCAHALILRENGLACDRGVLYYAASRSRVGVPIADDLVQRTLALIGELRQTVAAGVIPPPLEDSPKCPRCSLVGICLPDEVNLLKHGVEDKAPESAEADREGGPKGRASSEARQLLAPAAHRLPIYVQEQGALVAKRDEQLQIRQGKEVLHEARLLTVSELCLFGNVQVSTQALRELVARDIPVCYLSSGGWFYAITHGMSHKNVELRQAQYRTADDPARSLAFARRFVEGKVRNCRILLRRNHPDSPPAALAELLRLCGRTRTAPDMPTLLGLEGAAARVYFAHFPGLLKAHTDSGEMAFDFTTRNRRPPRDPVNALLSFAYAMLVKDLTVTLLTVGLDPYLGFYHQPRYGRPALALDLAEEFRPLIAESAVIGAINNEEVRPDDFVRQLGAVALTSRGRRQFLEAYERRLSQEIVHPLFRYAASYRRILSIQCRLLSRCLLGEIPTYRPFCTR